MDKNNSLMVLSICAFILGGFCMGYYTEIKSGALLGASIVFLVIAVWLLPKRVISKIQANDPTKTNEPIVEEPKDIIIDIPQEVEAELVKEVQ